MNIYAIILPAWLTPVLAGLLHNKMHQARNTVEGMGSMSLLILLTFFHIWFGKYVKGTPSDLIGSSFPVIYPVMIGYGVIGVRAVQRFFRKASNRGTRSILVLYLWAGILGVLLIPSLPLVILSWFVILYIIYRLITYNDMDLDARQDYRERLKDDYLDRF